MSRKTSSCLPGWLTMVVGLAVAMNAAAGAEHVSTVPASPPTTTGCPATSFNPWSDFVA